MSHLRWVLGTKPRFSARTASALNHWVIFGFSNLNLKCNDLQQFMGANYLQITHLIRDLHLEYIKCACNSTILTTITMIKNLNLKLEKGLNRHITLQRHANVISVGKRETQWDATSHSLGWLEKKDNGCGEDRDRSPHGDAGNVRWLSLLENRVAVLQRAKWNGVWLTLYLLAIYSKQSKYMCK